MFSKYNHPHLVWRVGVNFLMWMSGSWLSTGRYMALPLCDTLVGDGTHLAWLWLSLRVSSSSRHGVRYHLASVKNGQ